jgi:hypothetical protein
MYNTKITLGNGAYGYLSLEARKKQREERKLRLHHIDTYSTVPDTTHFTTTWQWFTFQITVPSLKFFCRPWLFPALALDLYRLQPQDDNKE